MGIRLVSFVLPAGLAACGYMFQAREAYETRERSKRETVRAMIESRLAEARDWAAKTRVRHLVLVQTEGKIRLLKDADQNKKPTLDSENPDPNIVEPSDLPSGWRPREEWWVQVEPTGLITYPNARLGTDSRIFSEATEQRPNEVPPCDILMRNADGAWLAGDINEWTGKVTWKEGFDPRAGS